MYGLILFTVCMVVCILFNFCLSRCVALKPGTFASSASFHLTPRLGMVC